MAAGTSQPTPMYADCGACGAREADLKCPCKTSHYCNAACQRADFRTHKKKCTHWLLKNIGRERNELQVMTAQSSSSVREVAAKEHRLAAQHKTVGDLRHPDNFPAAEQHLKQALELFRKLSALEKQGGFGADDGICLDNSISTLLSLGSLYYRSWNKLGDAVQAYKEARDSLRKNMRAHGSTPNRQQTLALILRAHGEVYNKQYEHELDKSQCFAARALAEEAVAINRALNSQADELALELATQPQHPLNKANRQQRTVAVLGESCNTRREGGERAKERESQRERERERARERANGCCTCVCEGGEEREEREERGEREKGERK